VEKTAAHRLAHRIALRIMAKLSVALAIPDDRVEGQRDRMTVAAYGRAL